jgi:hypothetical protein
VLVLTPLPLLYLLQVVISVPIAQQLLALANWTCRARNSFWRLVTLTRAWCTDRSRTPPVTDRVMVMSEVTAVSVSAKIGPVQLGRDAYVYVRQSTLTQLREHTESLRQYELR